MANFSVFHWVVLGTIIFLIYWALKPKTAKHIKYCTTCGVEDKPTIETRGHFLIEVILWICFIVPGLIYTIWRTSTKYEKCTSCGSKDLVPPTSPIALATKKRLAQA